MIVSAALTQYSFILPCHKKVLIFSLLIFSLPTRTLCLLQSCKAGPKPVLLQGVLNLEMQDLIVLYLIELHGVSVTLFFQPVRVPKSNSPALIHPSFAFSASDYSLDTSSNWLAVGLFAAD